MKSFRYSPDQVASGLRQAEEGTPVSELCRKMGISEQTFNRWKKSLKERVPGHGGGRGEALADPG